MLDELCEPALCIEITETAQVSTDPADDFLFAMARAGEADYLVTGDKAGVLTLGRHGKTRIVTTRELVEILRL
ncbi:MAG: hypothetical protein K2Y16_14975 [Burkholderiales bacterium]|nr:hypothetical protein [Burkholderiales bacterium]